MQMKSLVVGSAILALTAAAAHAADVVAPTPAPEELNFFSALYHGYADEWGQPAWPGAPNPGQPKESRRGPDQIPPAPASVPPYPFIDWPFGASYGVGIATPNSVDSPLMRGLYATPIGQPLADSHIQIYGWVNVGGNLANAKGLGGNGPVGYAFTPNILQLDQAVVYLERVPDTVQTDHWDWGFRFAPMYGENYRYTTAFGFDSNQLIYHNHYEGFDMPMFYGEVYIPGIGQGATVRVGRYISIPDIEAQLAPNNYMYTHSITYTFDNYTNTGIVGSIKFDKNWLLQAGLSSGTETFPWNARIINLPNGYHGQRDPGAQPTFTACLQWQSDNGWDAIYPCVNGLNRGNWGYNNLQWYGATFYHKFTENFHVSVEAYYEFQRNVNNSPVANPNATGYAGTPFEFMLVPPNLAQCGPVLNVCPLAKAFGILAYWNYQISPLDNLTLRTEFYNDENGQRTGFKTRYVDIGLGLQHWLSPQVEFRPELTWYRALDLPVFNQATSHTLLFGGADVIWHF